MCAEIPCVAILEGTFREGGQNIPEFKAYSERSNENGMNDEGKLLGKYKIFKNLGQGASPHVIFSRQISFSQRRRTGIYQSRIPGDNSSQGHRFSGG